MRQIKQVLQGYRDGAGQWHTLEYTLFLGENQGQACYALTLRDNGGETVCVPNLTGRLDRAQALFGALVRGLVTPTTLAEVLDDLLA